MYQYIAAMLINSIRVHAVCVCDNADYFHGHIDETLKEIGLSQSQDTEGRSEVKSKDIINIIEGYKGQGYGLSTDEELGKRIDHIVLSSVADFSLSF